jgi:hypothetical protein
MGTVCAEVLDPYLLAGMEVGIRERSNESETGIVR